MLELLLLLMDELGNKLRVGYSDPFVLHPKSVISSRISDAIKRAYIKQGKGRRTSVLILVERVFQEGFH